MNPSSMQPFTGNKYLPSRPRHAASRQQAKVVENLVQPEVWTMFDTLIIGSNIVPPAAAAVNFTNITASTSFFASRTIGNAGRALTSMTTASGYVDFPFKAFGMGVDVWCSHQAVNTGFSAAAAPPMSTALAFLEGIVYGASVTLTFATDPKLILPVSDAPGGGGVQAYALTDTRALGATQVAGVGSNGIPSVQARSYWKDYILFRGKDSPFTVTLDINPQALLAVQNLAALTVTASVPATAGIRIKFWGYRGKSLITGAPYRG